jgi:nucleoside 2-deoxyribosyltransferase
MREADGGLFNLTPFRGPSADAGTLVELGFMAALGKPVFAYTNAGGDLIDRLQVAPGLVRAGPLWRDADGMMAEDFGNADNLMVDETFVAQGRRVHRVAVEAAHRFIDLAGFEACLVEARAAFGF